MAALLRTEQERLLLWGPVAVVVGAGLGCGWLADIPVWAALVAAGLPALGGLAAQLRAVVRDSLPWLALAMLALAGAGLASGVAIARMKTEAVSAPRVAGEGLDASVTGSVVDLDRSQSGRWRLTVAVREIGGLAPDVLPSRVRLSLVSGTWGAPEAGAAETLPPLGSLVTCKARLNPPPGPVVPGAYDFARAAWFKQIGGVGYVVGGCVQASGSRPPEGWQAQLRAAQVAAARHMALGADGSVLPGGGLLAAIATGDRSWLTPEETNSLQVSGLAHIVSVSGLHVGLVYGLIFVTVWRLLALWGWLALRIDVRKIGAVAGFLIAGGYAVFTGSEAPAIRAVLMLAIATGALLVNRKAITMRGLAVAALLIILARPQSAVEPGFQMSFLATAALVAMWEVWPRKADGAPVQWPLRVVSWIGAALAISLVASLATAPVAAAEFGRVSQYSLLANLLAGPVQEFIVAPSAVFAALMAPMGWDGPFWAVARWGLALVMDIGAWVAGLPGAGGQVIWTGALAPALLCAAVLWLCLWRSRLRFLAALPALAGVLLWWSGPQPVGWIASGGVAVLANAPSTGPRLCREPGPSGGGSGAARFDAARLLDEARIAPADGERLLRNSGKPPADPVVGCRVTGPGWEGQWTANADGTDPHLLITIEGRFHRIRAGDLPQGGLILRHGGRLWLEAPPPGPGPWAANRNNAS